MADVISFLNYVNKLRGKNQVLEHASKIKAKKDPELEQELNVEIARLQDYLNNKYAWCRFKVDVTFSKHLEELEDRKLLQYYMATEKYPMPLFKVHDTLSVNLWYNKPKFDMWIGKYFDERRVAVEGFMNEFEHTISK